MLQSAILVALVGLATADFDPKLHAKSLTMSKSSFIEYFNAQNYSWKMADYGNLQEKYFPCSHINKKSLEKLPYRTHSLGAIDLPLSFDARINWPKCESIKDIYNQGHCGSCWTFGTAMTASDRTCIHKNIQVRLSEQDFQCSQEDVCGGGDPVAAFEYWRTDGLVTRECKPYDTVSLYKNECEKKCVDSKIDYTKDKHYAEVTYRVSNESDQIKLELILNGPIQAGYTVFEDFHEYAGGVYVHKHGIVKGRHSVRIIGYGVENGLDYWLVANSWGESWGENGFFKIKSYQGEIDFETLLVTGLPK